VAEPGDCEGQIHRYGGLADAAFAGADRDQMANARNRSLGISPGCVGTHMLVWYRDRAHSRR